MRLIRYSAGVALAALLAGTAYSQAGPNSPAAGELNPAAEQAPVSAPTAAPEFRLVEGVIATVNDELITSYDVRQRILLIIAMTQVEPTEENLPAIQRQAVNSLIDERLQSQELTRYEVQVAPEEVEAQITRMAQGSNLTAQEFYNFLAQGGIEPESLRKQIRTEIGWRRLVGGRFNARARVGRAQVEQTMQRLAADAARPQFLIGEIFLDASRVGGQAAALDGANQLVQQLVAGAPFQAVARQFSSAPSAANGGDAGWVLSGDGDPALQAAMAMLEPRQLSRPIPVPGGVWIIYMRDKRTGSTTSLVNLKQIMVELDVNAGEADVNAAAARLEAIRASLTCDNIIQVSRDQEGLIGSDLGESDVANLAPQFQQVARSAEVGTISSPVRTPLGLHLLAVCGKRIGGPDAPSFEQVEGRMMDQQLAMFERRYIRDLRADAAIETRS
jgi:peptidyl-prolyl cis-trans isomerase SurA